MNDTAPTNPIALEPIVVDTETIPTQDPEVIERLTQDIDWSYKLKASEVAPPSNWKDEEKITAWWRDVGNAKKSEIFFEGERKKDEAVRTTSLDAAYGQLAVIALKPGSDAPISLFDEQWMEPGYEAWLLNEFVRAWRKLTGHHQGHQLLGHNTEFDRRFMRQRSLLLGVRLPEIFMRVLRPWDDAVLDTMYLWTGDHHQRVKLDKLCEIFGIDRKGAELDGEEIDGSMVWDFVKRGEIGKVARYCGGDTQRTWDVYCALRGRTPRPAQPVFVPSELRAGPALSMVEAA
ncbi:MAG: hypothetical protein IIZ92_31555 [Aquincola sp.]|nr:hypothetical protein [Aquincola sp.]